MTLVLHLSYLSLLIVSRMKSWLYARLSEDGEVLMFLENDGFSQRFGWGCDRINVSWQLNLS
ncbi:hypothetical protein HRE53_03435 [Acaryochloris sp. 'Moss Beach']|uniref:hypothetical protein n=1 Tax=Acaryochloris sp. 'Moss Beach' TaxID=2740837 RepID=UPI001F26B0FA|nr:hypothetical protein [Acaryochloris sp. 'Moss Beach']UJB70207.1 hypothetical protein HRE53_03435 [Acaryochloris sp. 'Moss Beach']